MYLSAMAAAKQDLIGTLSEALAALRAGRLADAEALSRKLLEASPRDPAAHQLAGTVALQCARFEEAENWARASLTLRPGHAPAMMLAGRAARGRGDLAGAKDWFRRSSEIPGSGPEPRFQLGLAQIESADPEFAVTEEALIRHFPRAADGWREIGGALMRANRFERAEAAFARAVEASDDPSHGVNLGRAMLSRGRAMEAATVLRRAHQKAPDRLEPLLPLAQALRQTGAPREARQLLLRLIAARPDEAQTFYALGLACDDLRDWPSAISAYRRCVELQPDMPEAHVNLGLALQQIGELAVAVGCYREAVRLRPDTFGRIAQALPSAAKGVLWLDTSKLRRSLGG
jgi:tetratricopeptide (TPR) repeat protein